MQVKNIMSDTIDAVVEDTTLVQIAQKMRDGGIGSLPVSQGRTLIGMITDRDIVVRGVVGGNDMDVATARDAMSPDLVYCRADDSLEAVSATMADRKVRRLPVLDHENQLVGVISLGDVSRNEQVTRPGDALRKMSEPVDEPRT